jgi:WD40 repeat protein
MLRGGFGTATAIANDGEHVWLGEGYGTILNAVDGSRYASGHQTSITRLATIGGGRVVVGAYHEVVIKRDRRMDPTPLDLREVAAPDYSVTVTTGANDWFALHGHQAPLVAIATNGDVIASADRDGQVRVWRLPSTTYVPTEHAIARTATFAAQRRLLVIARRGPALDVHDLASGRTRRLVARGDADEEHLTHVERALIRERTPGGGDVLEIVASRDDRHLATVDDEQRAFVWDLDRGTITPVGEHVRHVAFCGDGASVVAAGDDEVVVWDAIGGTAVWRYKLTGDKVGAVACGRDRTHLAFVTTIGRGLVVVTDDDVRRIAAASNGDITAITFLPDGRTIVTGDSNGVVAVWDPAMQAPRPVGHHDGDVTHVVAMADGARVVTGSTDATVRLWSLDHHAEPVVLRGHTATILGVELGSDLDTIVTTSADRTARVWSVRSGVARVVPTAYTPVFAGLAANGELVTVDRLATIARFADDLPRDEAGLRAWIERATNVR